MRLALRSLLFVALLAGSARAADTQVPSAAKSIDTVGATAALGALGNTCTVALAGQNGAGLQLAAGTLVGTIVPELSFDGGTTWTSTFFDDPSTSNKAASIVYGSSNTATTRTLVGGAGASSARVRVSAFTSGTANCTLRASSVNDPSLLTAGSHNSAPAPAVLQEGAVGLADGTNPTATTAGNLGYNRQDTQGRLFVRIYGSNTFTCSVTTTATAVATIAGCLSPGAGLARYITDVYIGGGVATGATAAATITTGTGTTCGTGTTTLFRCDHTATGNCITDQTTPIKAGVASDLCFTDAATGTKNVTLSGFIGP